MIRFGRWYASVVQWVGWAVAAVLLGCPSLALAQNAGELSLTGRVSLNNDRSWNGTVPSGPAGGFSLSVDVSSRFGFEVAGDWPLPETSTTVTTFNDPVFGVETVTRSDTHQSPTLSGALLVHLDSTSRVRFTIVGGLAFVSHRSTLDIVVERTGGTVENVFYGSYLWSGPLFGLEASVRMGRHLALVPGVRLIWFPLSETERSSIIVRPGIGVRWTF